MLEFKPLTTLYIEPVIDLMTSFYAIDNYPIDVELTRKNFYYFIDNSHLGQVFAILLDEKFVGYMIIAKLFSFEFGGHIAFLDELYISEKARGKGLGKKAVKFAQQYAVEEKLKKLFLEVEAHNISASELYKKMSFKNHHRGLMIYHVES